MPTPDPHDRRPGRLVRQSPLFLALLATGAAVGALAMRRPPAPIERAHRSALADTLPAVSLRTLHGETVALRERLGGRPALLYVFGVQECLGCSNLPLEMKIVAREAPGVQVLLVGSGASVATFLDPITRMGLASTALIDEDRQLLRGLAVRSEPLVLLVDGSGRILLVDDRSASHAAQYPMGRLLRDLRATLAVAPTDRAPASTRALSVAR